MDRWDRRGAYKRPAMTEPYRPSAEELVSCGAVHPNYPDVVCISTTKCRSDWHVAFYKGKLMYFGVDAEIASAKSKLAHPVIRIK